MKKAVVRVLIVALFLYIAAIASLIIRQRSVIFRPGHSGDATPAQYGAPFEHVRIPAKDSGFLDGWWLQHPDQNSRPVLFYCHGNSANLSKLAEVAGIFYSYGWNAFLFDYRGYGASSTFRDFSEDAFAEDAEAAYRWAQSKAPEDRMIIWGHSLGSSVAARLASAHEPAGLIVEGAFPNLLSAAKSRYPWFPVFGFMLWDRFETETYLRGHRFPVLVVHAENDEVIPLALGEKLFELLNSPKKLLVVPKIGHKDFPSVARDYHTYLGDLTAGWLEERQKSGHTGEVDLQRIAQ